ncbi:MAG: polysaccharide biosynthesis protein [Firmicutes bacterium]|nr:polysaccharide biosynthesis protein [Bacillota bacterium]
MAASFFNRVLGFLYQVWIIRILGPEGIGLFNIAYPIYVLALVLASAGIPVAIAKLTAEEVAGNDLRGAYRTFHVAFACIVVIAVLTTAATVAALPLISQFIFPNPRARLCFAGLIPGILIVALCSAFRGFFQGLQQMTPTAVTQGLEQVVRVAAGLGLAHLWLPRGLEYATMGAGLGVVLGELAGFAVMLAIFFRHRPAVPRRAFWRPPAPWWRICRRIFDLAVPVTLTRFAACAFMSVDAVLIPSRLQAAGLSQAEATAAYGQLVGIAETLVFTPSLITISLATALVPAVAEAHATRDRPLLHRLMGQALRITVLGGLPCAAVLVLLPRELCAALFGYPEAGAILGLLALGGPFIYYQQTTTGILQGLGYAGRPLRNLVVASLFKTVGVYYVAANPQWHILGTAAVTAGHYVIIALLNSADLRALTGFRPDPGQYLVKPLVATVGMAPVLWECYRRVHMATDSGILALAAALPLGALSYALLLLLTGAVDRRDLARLRELWGLWVR